MPVCRVWAIAESAAILLVTIRHKYEMRGEQYSYGKVNVKPSAALEIDRHKPIDKIATRPRQPTKSLLPKLLGIITLRHNVANSR